MSTRAAWDAASPQAALGGIALTNAGAQVVAVQPAWVQALSGLDGVGAAGAGYMASAEMTGMAVATVLVIATVRRVAWHPAMIGALMLAATAHLGSTLVLANPDALRAVRFLAGLGAGCCVTLGFTVIGRTVRARRNFGLCVFATLVYGALFFHVASWLSATGGIAAFCVVFAGLCLAVVPLVRFLPRDATERSGGSAPPTRGTVCQRWACLLAFFMYFLAQGAFWSYAELVGTAGGLAAEEISRYLALGQFAGVAGAGATILLGESRAARALLVAGLLMGLGPALALRGDFTAGIYAAMIITHSFGWNLSHPLLLGLMARLGGEGAWVTYAVGMHKLGLALGPALAAAVLRDAGYPAVFGAAGTCFLICLLLVLVAMRPNHT